jgi:hypothetical protein
VLAGDLCATEGEFVGAFGPAEKRMLLLSLLCVIHDAKDLHVMVAF